MVLLTALGVGSATIIGALLGFIFKKASHRFADIVLSFAAGVMLSAAVLGLVLPSLEYGGKFALPITIGSSIMPLLNMIDVQIVVNRLVATGYTPEAAKELYVSIF